MLIGNKASCPADLRVWEPTPFGDGIICSPNEPSSSLLTGVVALSLFIIGLVNKLVVPVVIVFSLSLLLSSSLMALKGSLQSCEGHA